MRGKGGYTYIMSNLSRTVLYTGVTSNLYGRVYDHKNLEGSDFTKMYKCTDLVYYEFHERIESAIEREKQIKKWNRLWKDRMIKRFNPDLRDLSGEIDDMI
ncbi:MAG: GIY-YIG nuclease family protein [Cyclobacteriaceae bacterium]|nr:GIY-YIG nuclease family protein [Cyclobacteriaceae bacterium SS2]